MSIYYPSSRVSYLLQGSHRNQQTDAQVGSGQAGDVDVFTPAYALPQHEHGQYGAVGHKCHYGQRHQHHHHCPQCEEVGQTVQSFLPVTCWGHRGNHGYDGVGAVAVVVNVIVVVVVVGDGIVVIWWWWWWGCRCCRSAHDDDGVSPRW